MNQSHRLNQHKLFHVFSVCLTPYPPTERNNNEQIGMTICHSPRTIASTHLDMHLPNPILINESIPESILYPCVDIVSTWLTAHFLYAIYFTINISSLVHFLCFIIILTMPSRYRQANNTDQFEHDSWNITGDYYHLAYLSLVFELIVFTVLYVFVAFVYRLLVSGMHISSLAVARWSIEATHDIAPIVAMMCASRRGSSTVAEYQTELLVIRRILLVAKIVQFFILRHAEYSSQSTLNDVLVGAFSRLRYAFSHHRESGDRSMWVFIIHFVQHSEI
jgi:hypothetical protein